MSIFLFYFLATVAVVAGLVTITRRHPLHAAMSLVTCFIALAGLYASLTAGLLAILQILVYAGAIMALIVFVIMLLNVRHEDLDFAEPVWRRTGYTSVLVLPLFAVVVAGIGQLPAHDWPAVAPDFGTIEHVGIALFTRFAFPFEAISLLLLSALVGVVVLAKKRFT